MPSRYLTSRYMQAVGTYIFANHFYSFALKFYKDFEEEVTPFILHVPTYVNICFIEHWVFGSGIQKW